MKTHIYKEKMIYKIDNQSIRSICLKFTKFYHLPHQELHVHFVTTETICSLHKDYFDDPTPTDCISFPMDEGDIEAFPILGEIFICPETAARYTEKHGGEFKDEITLYLVHGLLHLIGFDDLTPNEKRKMRREEKKFLSYLNL